jgi:hypothetical protein
MDTGVEGDIRERTVFCIWIMIITPIFMLLGYAWTWIGLDRVGLGGTLKKALA